MFKKLAIYLFVLTLSIQFVSGQKTSFIIDLDKSYLDGNDTFFKEIRAGDTLLIKGGKRNFLLIKNFKGNPDHPIVMINSGGDVVIDTDHYFGISIQNCQYFKLTGTGNKSQTYGFKIDRVANGAGIGIGDLSSNYEIDHLSIQYCKTSGIFAKTDPDCSLNSVRESFTQYNTNIHDNYIAYAGNEGLYIGSTKYFGQTVNCNGKDTLLLPSLLDGVSIYNNIIKYSGWDGIQVSSASKNCKVFNNTVLFDSQDEHASQMSGIIIGGGSKCDCNNNFITQGKGDGIELHGLGGSRIFNNIIVDAGKTFYPEDLSQMKYGIFVTDVSVLNDSSFYILHNDIINPKSDGIRFSSIKSKKNVIASNVIINPGNFDFYENGNTRFKGKDSYIMFQNSQSDVTIKNNFLGRNIQNAGFTAQIPDGAFDFTLKNSSPLIDNGDPESPINFDFAGSPRPYGLYADIGAFENTSNTFIDFEVINSDVAPLLLENPVNNYLKLQPRKELNYGINLDIYNSMGQLIKHFQKSGLKIENQLIQADVSNLPIGIYFYSFHFGNAYGSGKFLKN